MPDLNGCLVPELLTTEDSTISPAEPSAAEHGEKLQGSLPQLGPAPPEDPEHKSAAIYWTSSGPRYARPPASNRAYSSTARSSSLSPLGRSHTTPAHSTEACAPQPLCMQDRRSVAEDIKATLSSAITDLKRDIQAMAVRIDDLEETTTLHDTAIQQLQASSHSKTTQLRDIHRHMKDLDNRGRRHNIWVRGIPESIENSPS